MELLALYSQRLFEYFLYVCQIVFGYHAAWDPVYGRRDRQFNKDLPHQTRLIKLQPGHWTDKIVCDLAVVGLGAQPKYDAISYVWGSREHPKEITLDGRSFKITPNLESALRRFRSTTEARSLWADALCINQRDEKERNQQVALMKEIYKTADRVLIWLGNDTSPDSAPVPASDDKIFLWTSDFASDEDKIQKYAENFLLYHQTVKAMRHKLQQDYTLGAFCLLNLLARDKHLDEQCVTFFKAESVRHAIVAALKQMMELPWWDRQWVIQETVLAKQVTVYHRGFEAPWEMFSRAARNYQKHRQGCCSDQNAKWPLADVQGISQFARVFRNVDDWRNIWKESYHIRLLPLLWQFRSRTTTDPKDKVFALLPLVTFWGQESAIPPTYNLSNSRVFRTVVENTIKVHNSLIVLMGNTEKSVMLQREMLPTWVPDWTVKPHPYELERLKRAELYDASNGRSPNPFFLGESFLNLKGVRVNVVDIVGNLMPSDDDDAAISTFGHWYDIAEMEKYHQIPYVTGHRSRGDAYWRTLSMDTEHAEKENENENIPLDEKEYVRASEGYGCEFTTEWMHPSKSQPVSTNTDTDDPLGFRRQFQEGKKKKTNKTFGPKANRNGTSSEEEEPEEAVEDNYQVKIDDAVNSATAYRRFFLTKAGFMGLGPAGMHKEDVVFVLDGGSTPFLLRPAGTRYVSGRGEQMCYELVGDCYVHGIMDGEAMEDTSKIGDVYIV